MTEEPKIYKSIQEALLDHSIVPPNRIKFILFNSNDKMVSELCEVVNSKYGKQDFIHQSKFELTYEQRKTLIDISTK